MSDVKIFPSKAELQAEVGNFIAQKAREAIEDHGFFAIAFSGGSVASLAPAGLLQLDVNTLDLSKWKVYFCDERYVKLEDEDSNFYAVNKNFLSKVSGINSANVFTIDPELSLADATKDYETKLTSSLGENARLDLLLIGMGPDGHVCSLFPHHPLLENNESLVASISDSPKPPPCRITLTFKAVNTAKCALFIVSGSGKAVVLQRVLEGNEPVLLPAARVKLDDGTIHWFMDKDAASQLKQNK